MSVGTLGPSTHRSRGFYSSLKSAVHDHGHVSSLDMFHYSEAARLGIWMCSEAERVSGLIEVLSPTSVLWLRFKSLSALSYQILGNVGQKTCCCFWQQSQEQQKSNPCGLALLPGTLSRIFSSILSNLGFIYLKNLVQELLWILFFIFGRYCWQSGAWSSPSSFSSGWPIFIFTKASFHQTDSDVYFQSSHTSIFWRVFLQGKDSK